MIMATGRTVTTTLSTEKIAALAPSQIPYERAVALHTAPVVKAHLASYADLCRRQAEGM